MTTPTWTTASIHPPSLRAPGYSSSLNPAYTSVNVRQNFGGAHYPPTYRSMSSSTHGPPPPANPPPAAMSSPAPQPHKTKVDWPQSVRDYVQRSFFAPNLEPTVSHEEMQQKLKDVISQAQQSGSLNSINWEQMPLPQYMILEERMSQMSLQGSSPNPALQTAPRSGSPTAKLTLASRKRKSSELGNVDLTAAPWRSNGNGLKDRITHASPGKADDANPTPSKFQKQLEKRQKRLDGGYKSSYRSPSPPPNIGPVVGTSEELLKRYLRLTSAPVPSLVRPERVLRQTLELLKKKWRKENNYSYICDQFKSLRQDLTVQHIRNDFTVSVYEIHARIALEKGDLGEYNQCQTQLRSLYQLGLQGNALEFKAYRILYFIHIANRAGMNDALADLTTAEKEAPAIQHALDVRSALALGNYHRFFQLYMETPDMGAYLIDMFVGRQRLAALCNICKAYKPDIRLRFITEELGFESDADAAQFVVDHNGQHLLEERRGPDGSDIVFLTGKAGQLFESQKAEAFRRVDIKGQI